MMPEEAVTRWLRSASAPTCPDDVLTRLRATVTAEVELRRASRGEPDTDSVDLKAHSPLWSNQSVDDR